MKIRINDIECRAIKSKHYDYEMVKWYENPYYGKEQEYIDNGYEKVEYPGGWGLRSDHTTVNESCFKNPESCYVVAFLIINKGEPDVDMQTVGSRLLELSSEERQTFFEVYKLANDKILKDLI